MITFTHTTPTPGTYDCKWTARFGKERQALEGHIMGDIDTLRHHLRREYHAHIMVIGDMLLSIPQTTTRAMDAHAQLLELIRTNMHLDHVNLSRELMAFDIWPLVPILPATEYQKAYDLSILWQNTLTDLAHGKKSLWVYGPIEQLDGTITEPWKDGQLSIAA